MNLGKSNRLCYLAHKVSFNTNIIQNMGSVKIIKTERSLQELINSGLRKIILGFRAEYMFSGQLVAAYEPRFHKLIAGKK